MLGWGRKMGLAARFSVRMVCVAYLAFAAVGYVTYRAVHEAVRNNVARRLTALVDRKALQIEAALDAQKMHAVSVSHVPEVARFLLDFSPLPTTMDPIEYEARHAALRAALGGDAGQDAALFLLSRKGELLFSMDRSDRFGAAILNRPDTALTHAFARATVLLQPQKSDFRYDARTGAATAWVVAPVVSDQAVAGVVALRVRPHILDRVARDEMDLGQTGETFIVTAEATASDHPPILLASLRHAPDATRIGPAPDPLRSAFPMPESLSGREGEGMGVDYRNQAVIARWRPLSVVRGGISVKMDTHEALAPIAKAKEILTWAGLVAPALLVGLAVSLSRSVTRPIAQMTQTVREMGQGNFTAALNAKQEQTRELEDMAEAFRVVATQIQATYQEMEAKTQALTQKVVDLESVRENMQVEVLSLREAEQTLRSVNENLEDRVMAWAEIAKKNADALSDAGAELDHFAHVAAHDLREPLRIISGYTQLLAKRYKGQLDSDADQFIDYVVDGVNRMKQTIDDLVVYSRVDAKTDGGEMTQFDATTALERALAHTREIFTPLREAIVTYDPLPTILADQSQIVQLFERLVDNGMKFHNGEAPRVHVSAEEVEGVWVFSVRDNGIGIEAQYFERIFTLFQRLHPQGKYAGTGIGLAVCKRIVSRHGGRIWVESTVGEGSTFKFTIPQTDSEASSMAETV